MVKKFRVYTKEFIDNLTRNFVNYDKNIKEVPNHEAITGKFYAPFAISEDNYEKLYRMPADKWIRMVNEDIEPESHRLKYRIEGNNIKMPFSNYFYLISFQPANGGYYQFQGRKMQDNKESFSNLCWISTNKTMHFKISANSYAAFFTTTNLNNAIQVPLINSFITIFYQNFGDIF